MEWCYSVCGKYRIESLSAATFSDALNVVREAFFTEEPACIGTEVKKNPLAIEELTELCADAALDGVTMVAVEIDTQNVVSVSFNKLQVLADSCSEKQFFEIFADERCTQPSSRALVQLMANLDAQGNFFKKYGVDCSLEIMFLATLREHRHRSLGLLLCKTSVEIAKKLKNGPVSVMTLQDLGYIYSNMKQRAVTTKCPKFCQIICSSIGTQKIVKKLNFTVELRLPFRDLVYNGKSYVERIGSDPFIEICSKPLD